MTKPRGFHKIQRLIEINEVYEEVYVDLKVVLDRH